MDRPTIYIQENVFWEDEHGEKETEQAIAFANRGGRQMVRHDSSHLWPGIIPKGCNMRGSLEMAKVAGFTFPYANALHWLPKFRDRCVNSEGYFIDLAEAQNIVSSEGARYLRPVEGFKDFTGQVFDSYKLQKEIAFLQQNKNIKANELICVIAPPKYIAREWRLIFVDGQCVGGSQYSPDILSNVPIGVIDYAKQIAEDEYFTNVFNYVIDIGIVNGQLKLVEINAFETASFYAADLSRIYESWVRFLTNPDKVLQTPLKNL